MEPLTVDMKSILFSILSFDAKSVYLPKILPQSPERFNRLDMAEKPIRIADIAAIPPRFGKSETQHSDIARIQKYPASCL